MQVVFSGYGLIKEFIHIISKRNMIYFYRILPRVLISTMKVNSIGTWGWVVHRWLALEAKLCDNSDYFCA